MPAPPLPPEVRRPAHPPPPLPGSVALATRRRGEGGRGGHALEGSRRCELCGAVGRLRCRRCRLTHYCNVDHQKADWVSIHERICPLLIPIRTSLPCLLSEKQRKHGMEQLVKRQNSLTCLRDVSLPQPLGTGKDPCLSQLQQSSSTNASPTDCRFQLKLTGNLPSSLNRHFFKRTISFVPKYIIDLAYSTAQEFVLDGKHKEAIPAALQALRFSTEVYGSSSVQLVPAYLLLAEASTGVGHLPQASKYLSQAQWIVLRTPDCSVAVQYKLHRSLGLFCAAEGNFEQALYHLANDIYLASSTFGLKSIETSGGYFHMANIFFHQNKMDIANSLYAEVTDIWHAFLVKSVQAQEQILKSQPEMSPFTKDKEVSKDHMTEAQQAEAIRVLNAVLDVREQAPKQRPGETARVLHALAMLYYLIMDLSKAREVGMKAFELVTQLPQQESLEAISHLLKLINSKPSYRK